MKIDPIIILSLLLFTACEIQKEKAEQAEINQEHPNIVLIIGDDQGYPYFGFMGANYIQTPHMDAFAESGTLFTNGYVPYNHCRPSLQSLMTGTLPIDYQEEVTSKLNEELATLKFESVETKKAWQKHFRHHAMKHFRTLPALLANQGYVSFQGGKWWEFNYQNGGFTHGMTTGWTKEERKNGGKWFKQFMGGDGLKLARATIEPVYEFIEKEKDKPFFIWYAPELPHYPFDAPDKYYNIYKDQEMTESAKRYYANCTWFDDGVGALKDHLKAQQEFDNTLFIYVNDNGWEQNPDQEFRSDSMRWHNGGDKGKLSIYDQSFHTPIIFSWKDKIQAGVTNDGLIHSTDIPATILDYLKIDIPNNYHGVSYKNIIEQKEKFKRTEIIGSITQVRDEKNMMGRKLEGYWLRSNDWFFNWNKTDNVKMLFDMNEDPLNNYNIANKHPNLVKEYADKIVAWRKEKK